MTNDPEPIGDDYHEPDFDEPVEPVVTDPREALDQPLPPVEGPLDAYVPYDLSKARPSVSEPVKAALTDEEGNPLPEFDEKCQEDFHGLAFIGALSKTFTWLGHRFTIRTMTVEEALAVATLTKQWDETLGGPLAYRTAVAAVVTQKVDGQDLPMPVGAGDRFTYFQQRFDYAITHWFQFTIDAIYNEYLELELKVRQVVDAMGKASGQTASTPG